MLEAVNNEGNDVSGRLRDKGTSVLVVGVAEGAAKGHFYRRSKNRVGQRDQMLAIIEGIERHCGVLRGQCQGTERVVVCSGVDRAACTESAVFACGLLHIFLGCTIMTKNGTKRGKCN